MLSIKVKNKSRNPKAKFRTRNRKPCLADSPFYLFIYSVINLICTKLQHECERGGPHDVHTLLFSPMCEKCKTSWCVIFLPTVCSFDLCVHYLRRFEFQFRCHVSPFSSQPTLAALIIFNF